MRLGCFPHAATYRLDSLPEGHGRLAAEVGELGVGQADRGSDVAGVTAILGQVSRKRGVRH